MAVIEINFDPTRRELRVFAGLLFPLFFALVGGLAWYGTGAAAMAVAIWAPAGVLALLALSHLGFARLLYVAWMRVVQPIGWAVSHLILGSIYFLVITPIGILRRTVGGDRMARRLDREASSYWIEYPSHEDADYFRQF